MSITPINESPNAMVTQHNHLVEASYSLTLDEKRLILSAIATIKNGSNMPEKIRVHAKDFAKLWGLGEHTVYSQLKAAKDRLYERSILIYEGEEKVSRRWLDLKGEADAVGYVSIGFSHHLKPFLEKLKGHYTSYHLSEVREFKSAYTIRMYELIMQYRSTGWRKTRVDDLRDILMIGGKYKTFSELERNVIARSVDEINTQTPYCIIYEKVRKGRAIDSIIFRITDK